MFSWNICSVKAIKRAPVQGALLAAALAASPAALADAVTDWNAYADTINLGPPPVRARATAIMHVAIHDALNSIDPKYGSYTNVPRARHGASPDAAVGEAAYRACGATRAGGSAAPSTPSTTPGNSTARLPEPGVRRWHRGRRSGRQCDPALRDGDGPPRRICRTRRRRAGRLPADPATPPAAAPNPPAIRRLGERHAVRPQERLAVPRRAAESSISRARPTRATTTR